MSDEAGGEMPETSSVNRKDEANWAAHRFHIEVKQVPDGASNLNVDGRRMVGALQGFGQLWQKTYQVRLRGVDLPPAAIMKIWKEKFPAFQPPENKFFPSMAGITPGEVVFIEGKVPALPGTPNIMPVASGVVVLYADDISFTVMTPEGFPESGWNTFSVYEEDGCVVAQVQSLCRATDPLYEFYFRFLGSSDQQEKTWRHVLTTLASHLGASDQVTISKTCIDPKVQWSQVKNILKSAAIRTVLYKVTSPIRWITGRK
jgi:hypothetical protein